MSCTRFAWILAVAATLILAACGSEPEEVILSSAQEQVVIERLTPEGEVSLQGEVATAPAGASGEERSPEDIYNSSCMACHATGVAGAPKLGAPAEWEERIAQGMDLMYQHTFDGLRGMPPRGLCMTCSDEELMAVVDWMLEQN